MKRHTGPTNVVAPRRLLLQEHAANATTTAATNSTSGSKATPIPPPQPPRNRYYPSGAMPSPDPNGTTDAVRFDSSSVAVTALVILSALFFLGFFSVYARRFFAPDWDNPDPSASRRRRFRHRGRVPGPAATASGRGYGGRGAPRGLDPEAIKALPLVRYSEEAADQKNKAAKAGGAAAAAEDGDVDNDHRCCAVCLGEFEEGEELRAIPRCGHAFHRECIDAWLSAHGSCPLCRTTDLFGAAKRDTPQMRCEVCRLESVVVVPSSQEAAAAAATATGQGEGGSGQRRPEGDNSQQPTDAAPSPATPVVPPEAREIGAVGRSRSWLCMSAAAASEKPDEEKGPQPQAVGREEQELQPRRSFS